MKRYVTCSNTTPYSKLIVYHGTSLDSARSIVSGGFKLDLVPFNTGVTTSLDYAMGYGQVVIIGEFNPSSLNLCELDYSDGIDPFTRTDVDGIVEHRHDEPGDVYYMYNIEKFNKCIKWHRQLAYIQLGWAT